jgi:hypothetical protein
MSELEREGPSAHTWAMSGSRSPSMRRGTQREMRVESMTMRVEEKSDGSGGERLGRGKGVGD